MTYFIDTSDKRTKILIKSLKKTFSTEVLSNESYKNIHSGDILVFSPAKKFNINDISFIPENTKIVCGNLGDEIKDVFDQKNIEHLNIMQDEEFTIKNANLTAEGVLALVLEHSEKSIYENKVLLLGNGRISSALAILFGKLGVKFSIVAYDIKKVPKFYIYTDTVIHGEDFFKTINEYDIIVNTIPSKIISDENIGKIPSGVLFIETASQPCLEKSLVKNFIFVEAPGLPQRFSAQTAAKLMENYILGETK